MNRWADVNGIYQIYPRSFCDASGDGNGDLRGVIEKLDYLKGNVNSLGVDAIWLSPFYKSPMHDSGYDVSDYYDVDPLFGDLADFKQLLDKAHHLGIKVMIDYIPNHTSSHSAWFQESRSSLNNPKRDWYIWRDPKEGREPNNWRSDFGGSAWQFDSATKQYYLHSFLSSQPDLNWANPEVRRAMLDVIRYWLSMGVDGLRTDAIDYIAKDQRFFNNPIRSHRKLDLSRPYQGQKYQYQIYNLFAPELKAYLSEICATVEQFDNRIIIYEHYPDLDFPVSVCPARDQYEFLYSINPAVGAPFLFGTGVDYDAKQLKRLITEQQANFGGRYRSFYCFGNHDRSRLASRYGAKQARVVALLQLMLPGTPIIYYGEELGMTNSKITPEQARGPLNKAHPRLRVGRDAERGPMQWNNTPNAGFSLAQPWLPVGANYKTNNVQTELNEPYSNLDLYKTLLRLRSNYEPLRSGRGFRYLEHQSRKAVAFAYQLDSGDQIKVFANLSKYSTIYPTYDHRRHITILASTAPITSGRHRLQLKPNQAVVILEGRPNHES